MAEYVLFARSGTEAEGLKPDSSLGGRQQLAQLLDDRDLRPAVSFGAESAFNTPAATVAAYELTERDEVGVDLGHLALRELGGVRFMLNRAKRSLTLPDLASQLPPRFNTNKVRSLGYHKDRMYDEVLASLELAIPTANIDNPDGLRAFMKLHDAAAYAAKPSSGGKSGKGVHILKRDTVASRFADEKDWYGAYLLQPAIDTTQPFPPSITPYDAATQELFETSNHSGLPKEIRMYGVYAAGAAMVFPVARLVLPPAGDRTTSDNTWFYIDPDRIPERIYDGTKDCIQEAAFSTGSEAACAAFDWVHGFVGDHDPDGYVIDGNTCAPYFLGYDKHAGIAAKLQTIVADQIAVAVYGA